MNVFILEVKESGVWKARRACITNEEADIAFNNHRIDGIACRIVDNDTGEILQVFDPDTLEREEVVYCDDCDRRLVKGDVVYWYDCVVTNINDEPIVDRRYFCTEGCAGHHFKTGTLRRTATSNHDYSIEWKVELKEVNK